MGARPIALLDGLRFGKPGFEFGRAVGGIGHYGNCVGVPTVGGDTVFDDAYASNPLVNAMCVGLLPTDRVTRAEAGGAGNHVVLFGATTGRDGIGGASVLASQELSDDDEDKRPSVQVGDPFTGKKLIEASLALVEGGLVQSLQDLGAAGLASSLSEMARGGVGLDVHLDRVPLREADMEPVEIVISESQERMVCVTDQPDAVAKVCARWELEVADIGVVTASGALRMFWDDEVVGEIPAELLTEETPRYRVATRPRTLQAPISHRPIKPETAELLDLLRTPGLKSRVSVYRRYDHLVGSRTVRRPGLDAAVLRLRPSHRGLAVSLDGSGRIASLDPQTGGMLAVLEAARNVACAGGKPLALTDCLNFGNPEKPEIAWELTEAIEGMSLACEALGIPVVSGNVSLYNETDGTAIHPTPVVGCVGLVPDVRLVPAGVAGGRCDLRRRRARARARRLGVPGALPRRPGRKAPAPAPRRRGRARPLPLARGSDAHRLPRRLRGRPGGRARRARALVGTGRAGRARGGRRRLVRRGRRPGGRRLSPGGRVSARGHALPARRRGGRLEDLRRRARRPRPRRRLRLMCGIFGIHAPDRDVARLTYFGLFALQHRGQESAGIAVSDEGRVTALRDMGLVTQVFSEQKLRGLTGQVAVGHARYSTTGSTHWANAQPIIQQGRARTVALGHNGNLTNTSELRAGLLAEGARLRSTSDTEVIAALIARDERPLEEAVAGAMGRIQGAFSAVLLAEGKLVGFRDPLGIRPLVLGRLEDDWLLASETCALDLLGAEVERELAPGEMVVVDENGYEAHQAVAPDGAGSLCIFEFIYFARPDSKLRGVELHGARVRMGEQLAAEAPVEADLVMAVPDSGTPAAIGFARASGIPFAEGLIKNRYVGRTFIQPDQALREHGIKTKFNPLAEVSGKRVVVVDDSIVRGTTTRKIVAMLFEEGALEVHLRISSPPIVSPCFYGIDMADEDELIAGGRSVEAVREQLGATSLAYLSLEGLQDSTRRPEGTFCRACLTRDYPTEIPEDLKLAKLRFEGQAAAGSERSLANPTKTNMLATSGTSPKAP